MRSQSEHGCKALWGFNLGPQSIMKKSRTCQQPYASLLTGCFDHISLLRDIIGLSFRRALVSYYSRTPTPMSSQLFQEWIRYGGPRMKDQIYAMYALPQYSQLHTRGRQSLKTHAVVILSYCSGN
jgi:hypothetical protein